MKRVKFLVFLIVSSALLQVNLSALISSRVEGKVIDKSTGLPIEGADVVLLFGQYSGSHLSTETAGVTKSDKKGMFKFDGIEENSYYLAVFKKGYTYYGPFWRTILGGFNMFLYDQGMRNDLEDAVKENLIDKADVNIVEIDIFKVKQGEIKHFVINLEKESILDLKILRKTPAGIENTIDSQVRIYHNKYIEALGADSVAKLEGLKDGIIAIECYPKGYPKQVYKNIKIEKGKTTTVEKILDFTSGQVLHGFVKHKDTGRPIMAVSIYISRIVNGKKEYEVEDLHTDQNGEFWIGGFEPGKYSLEYHNYGDYKFEFKEIIEFKPGEKKEITREF